MEHYHETVCDAAALEQGDEEALSLSQLELAVEEAPEEARFVYRLGRAYMAQSRWVDGMKTLRRHLTLPQADEVQRCASMRLIAQCCQELGEEKEGERWLLRACGESPGLREPWLALAKYRYHKEDWHGVIFAARRALEITRQPDPAFTEPEAWGELPYDLLAVALYYIGDYRHALAMGEEALKRSPMDERLRSNVRRIRQKTMF